VGSPPSGGGIPPLHFLFFNMRRNLWGGNFFGDGPKFPCFPVPFSSCRFMPPRLFLPFFWFRMDQVLSLLVRRGPMMFFLSVDTLKPFSFDFPWSRTLILSYVFTPFSLSLGRRLLLKLEHFFLGLPAAGGGPVFVFPHENFGQRFSLVPPFWFLKRLFFLHNPL